MIDNESALDWQLIKVSLMFKYLYVSICSRRCLPRFYNALFSQGRSQRDGACVCCAGVEASQEVGLWSPVPCWPRRAYEVHMWSLSLSEHSHGSLPDSFWHRLWAKTWGKDPPPNLKKRMEISNVPHSVSTSKLRAGRDGRALSSVSLEAKYLSSRRGQSERQGRSSPLMVQVCVILLMGYIMRTTPVCFQVNLGSCFGGLVTKATHQGFLIDPFLNIAGIDIVFILS